MVKRLTKEEFIKKSNHKYQIDKDLIRQQEIEHFLDCKFVRIK